MIKSRDWNFFSILANSCLVSTDAMPPHSETYPSSNSNSKRTGKLSRNRDFLEKLHNPLCILKTSPKSIRSGSFSMCSDVMIPSIHLLNVYKNFWQFSLKENNRAINTARGALSVIIIPDIEKSFGSNPKIVRFMKGVYGLRPSLPRCMCTLDVSVLLEHIKGQPPKLWFNPKAFDN